MDVYKKINKAVIAFSAIHTIRSISQANPLKTIDLHNEPNPIKYPNSEEADDEVLINFDYSSQPPPFEEPKSAARVAKISFAVEPDREAKVGFSGEGKVHIEDSISDYIDRVRIGMRSKSNVGSERKNSTRKDEFSEYLDRTGIKIRTTSSIAGGGRF